MTSEPAQIPDPLSRVRTAAEAALGRKAIDLQVLDLSGLSDFTEHFVICSASNARQVQAISDGVVERLRDEGVKPLAIEGYDHGAWVLLDYGSFLVHVFDPVTRNRYGLERLWSDGTDVTDRVAV